MKTKKTWFSFLLWLLYTVMTGILSAVYLSAAGMQAGNSNQYAAAVLVAVMLMAVAGVWFAGHKAAGYLNRRFAGDKHLADMWEWFLVLGLTAASLLYRFRMLLQAAASEKLLAAGGFYELAAVKASEGVPSMAHGASYLYTLLLSVIFSFVGNKVIAGVVLQLFLEIAAMLVFYAGVRLLMGRVEAVSVLAVLAFSQSFCNEMLRLTPEILYLLIYAVGICIVGWCSRHYSMAAGLIMGAVSGLLAYLDISGLTLLFPSVWICLNRSREKSQLWKRLAQTVAPAAAAGLLMLIMLGIQALSAGQGIGTAMGRWCSTYTAAGGVVFPAGPDAMPALSVLVCFFAALCAVGFWFHKGLKQDIWILILTVFTLLDMFEVGGLQYDSFLTAVWGVMAGIGITSMGMEKQEELETIPEEALPFKELVVEEITLEEEKPKIQFIENPLPLPKKHVKKEMDFDHIVDENDDFDI